MKESPPNRMLAFFRWFCHPDYIEDIEGDLIERFERNTENLGAKKAKWIFASDILKLFRPGLMRSIFGTHQLNNIGMLHHFFKVGSRNLLKNKSHSIINIAGLTLGITCCIIIYSFIKYESSFDSFHPYAERTFRVVQHTQFPEETFYLNTTAYPLAAALRNDLPEMAIVTQSAGPYQSTFSVVDELDEVHLFEEENVLYVDTYYPKVFDVEWVLGNPETALQEINSIVLTESLARRFFNNEVMGYQTVLGKTVTLDKDQLRVTGIIKDAPGNTSLPYNMLIPYELFKKHNSYHANNWSANHQGTTFGVLDDPFFKEGIESKIGSWKKKYLMPEDDSRISYFLQPILEMHSESLYGSSSGSYLMPRNILRAASIVGIFIFIIALVNFINLVTAQSVTRSKEVGIRKVVGGTRYGLIKQFSFENTMLVVVAMVISIGLSHMLLYQLNDFLSIINLQLALTWNDAGFVFLIGLLTITLAVIYPSFVLSSFKPLRAIKDKDVLGKTSFTLRKSLITFQFVVVQLFVIAAIIAAIQMDYFRNEDLGFTSEAVVITPTPEYEKLDVYRNSLLQIKGISEVSFGSGPPMGVNGLSLGTTFRLPHESEELGKRAEMKIGDPNYLTMYDLKLVAGKGLTDNKKAFDEFVVNEKLIRSMGWAADEAIGQKLQINEGAATIIGVVEDFHNHSLQWEITPCIIMNWKYFQDNAFIKIEKGNLKTLASIAKTWKAIFPSSMFRYEFVDDSIEKEYIMENLIFDGFKVFSFLVILIGCLGLYGLMSFVTLQKTKEVGIRKVLGASVMQIVTFFSMEFVLLIGLAFFIAAPLVYYFMGLWLQNFTYRVDLSVWMFVVGGVVTLIIATMTSSVHAFRAANANPVDSLRNE